MLGACGLLGTGGADVLVAASPASGDPTGAPGPATSPTDAADASAGSDGGTIAVDSVADAPTEAAPTPPPAPGALVVAVVGTGDDVGRDAVLAALAERPDLVAVAVDGPDPVTAAGAALARTPDLVVVGASRTWGPGDGPASDAARLAADHGVPALVVAVERSDGADWGAVAGQLLEVLDAELAPSLAGEATPRAIRLTVPSCRHGLLRGRVPAAAVDGPALPGGSDCLADVPGGALDERTAFAGGWATIAVL